MTDSVVSVPSSSTPSSPKAKAKETKSTLSISNVANIFIRMRRHYEQATAHLIDSSSGEPQTWPSLAGDGITIEKRIPVDQEDFFICSGAVDVVKLLRNSRVSLYKKALDVGHSPSTEGRHIVLVDEQWECEIMAPKNKHELLYKVHIIYSASATLSEHADPQRPIATDRVKGVPGLMTVLDRH